MNAKVLTFLSIGLLVCLAEFAQADNTPTTARPRLVSNLFGMLTTAKVSLDEAIQTAEQTVAGKLVKAETDSTSSPNSYKIAIADTNTHTITYIKIDASTGKVLSTRTWHPHSPNPKVHSKPTFGASIHSSQTKPTVTTNSPPASAALPKAETVKNPLTKP